MKSTKFWGVLAALGLLAAMAAPAGAGTIFYDYQTTLSLASGTDAMGLNGAVLNITADVDSSAVYITRFGYAAVIMNNDAMITISGSSDASNNGTFALAQLAFYPTFAGLFADPEGVAATITLPVGGTLTLQINTLATATGATEIAGDTVNLLDFGPAASVGYQLDADNGDIYNQINASATATESSTPEPATMGLMLASLCGLGLVKRFKVR